MGVLGSKIPQRWVTVCLGFLGIFSGYGMRACLSIAITEMTLAPNHSATNKSDDPYVKNYNHNNTQLEHSNGVKYDWDERTQGLILSSFYWGYIFSAVLAGVICHKFGGKRTLDLSLLFTSVFTLLIPYCIYWGGSTALIILRIALGFGEGAAFPAVMHLMAHWIPEDERSTAGAIAFSAVPLGSVFGTLISGLILQHSAIGWPMVFYFYGTVALVSFLLNTIFCYNEPSENPYISDAELTYLKKKLDNTPVNLPAIPWWCILKSPAVWAWIVAKFGTGWGHETVLSDLPKYMKSVLKFSSQDNGYFSSIQHLAMWLDCVLTSWIADKAISKRIASVTIVRKIGLTLATTGPAIFLVAASHAGSDRFLVIALQMTGIALSGCAAISVHINPLDLSPNYASSIIGLGNGISIISGALTPYVVGVLTPNQTLSEWRLVFWIVFAVAVAGNLVFLVYGTGKVQKWNDPAFLNKNKIAIVDEVKGGVELLPLNKS